MVDLGKVLQSGLVGVVDEGLQYADEHATVPRTESFKTWQDWGRMAIFALGLIGPSFMPRYKELSDTMVIASTPLVVKTLAVPLKSAMGITRSVRQPTWVPNRVPTPARRGVPRPAGAVGRSYYPDADKVLAY